MTTEAPRSALVKTNEMPTSGSRRYLTPRADRISRRRACGDEVERLLREQRTAITAVDLAEAVDGLQRLPDSGIRGRLEPRPPARRDESDRSRRPRLGTQGGCAPATTSDGRLHSPLRTAPLGRSGPDDAVASIRWSRGSSASNQMRSFALADSAGGAARQGLLDRPGVARVEERGRSPSPRCAFAASICAVSSSS